MSRLIGMSRPTVGTMTVTAVPSAEISLSRPLFPAKSPSTMSTVSPTAKDALTVVGTSSRMMAATSSSVSGTGFDPGPTKPVRHDHFHEHVGREDLAFDLTLHASVRFDDRLDGDAAVEDQMTEIPVFDDLFQIHLDLVLVAGVRMRYVPSRSGVLFIEIAHASSPAFRQKSMLSPTTAEENT